MKKPVYINSVSCISAQNIFAENWDFVTEKDQQVLFIQEPNYKDYIPAGMIRRMSKVVKMSTVAAKVALEKANISVPEAIIYGTGMGPTDDSEKFLRNVVFNDEEFLTPTYFIQSTHNTVAGQIALAIQCHGYNFTYVNTASSLEFSLLDAKLQLQNNEAKSILVGASDEISERIIELYKLNQTIKKTEDLPVNYFHPETKGAVWGEGASFFVLENEKKSNTQSELIDIDIINRLEKTEISDFISAFLEKNNLTETDIDALILGNSGDAESDQFYKFAAEKFENAAQLYFKHLCGEFNTSSGFAFALANHILKNQHIPELIKINNIAKENISYLVIYNHLFGLDHCLTLLKKVD